WVKARILESAQAFPYGWRAWFGATVLGSKPPASTPWLKNFRLTGLLHLVVVSGFHVTFVAGLIGGLFRVPLMILYAFRIVSPGLWVRLSCLSNLQSLAAVAVYC